MNQPALLSLLGHLALASSHSSLAPLGAPSSYVPDLLGCVATANTREELLEEIREAIEFHIEGMLQDGESIPDPQATSEVVEVSAVAGT